MKKIFLESSIKLIKKYNNYSDEQIEIIAYGLEGIYLTFTKAIVIFALAFALGVFKDVILLLISYNVIRTQAFGVHASKSIYCLISSLIMFIGGAFLCKYIIIPLWLMIIIAVICTICLFLYAPADTYKRPIVNVKKRRRFRIISTILGVIYTILIIVFKDSVIANYMLIGMFLGVIVILPITYKIFNMPYANYKTYNYGV